jgi:hypothetical protein
MLRFKNEQTDTRHRSPINSRKVLLSISISLALVGAGCSSDDGDGGSDGQTTSDTGTTGETGATAGTGGGTGTGTGTGTGGDTGGTGGTDGGGTGGGGAVQQLGFLSLSSDGTETELIGSFFAVNDAVVPANELAAFFELQNAGTDVCIVDSPADDDEAFDLDFDLDVNFGTSISAGETLIVTSPAGTYTTLIRQSFTNPIDASSFLIYAPEQGELNGTPPSALVVDIPGDVFPAFANTAIPDIPPALTDFSPAVGAPAPLDTTYTWTPSGVASARVSLEIDGGAEQPSVECYLADDGSFALPADIAAQLAGVLSPTVDDVYRDASRILQSGSALLVLISEPDD